MNLSWRNRFSRPADSFQQGAEYADDYRSWFFALFMMTLCANHQYQKTDLIAYLPPSPGMELIDAAQKSYESQA